MPANQPHQQEHGNREKAFGRAVGSLGHLGYLIKPSLGCYVLSPLVLVGLPAIGVVRGKPLSDFSLYLPTSKMTSTPPTHAPNKLAPAPELRQTSFNSRGQVLSLSSYS